MPTNPDKLKIVIDQFTPEVLGVFWITNESLGRELACFEEFNYLFDGLISQYLYGQSENKSDVELNKSNIFFTHNFNLKLFLVHLKSHSEISKVLDDQIKLAEQNKTENRKKILILNLTEKNWGSDLIKRYPQYVFQDLEISK